MRLLALKKNLSYRLFEAIFSTIILLLQNALLAQHLSFKDFGTYSVGMLWSLIIIIISYGFSLPTFLSRELCQREQKTKIVTNVFILQALIGLLSLVIFLLSFLNLEYFQDLNNTGFLIYISCSLILAAPISMQGILSSDEKMGMICLIKTIAFSLNIIALYFILKFNLGLSWVFLSHSILALVFAAGFYFTSNTNKYLSIKLLTSQEIKYSLSESSWLVCITLFSQLYSKIDLLMIDILSGKEEVALYSSAYRLLEYLLIIANALAIAIFPNLMKLAKEPNKFWLLYSNFIILLVCSLFPISAIFAIFPEQVLGFIYGEFYTAASGSLQLLMLASCIAFLNSPFATVFIAYKKQKIYLIATFIALIINVIGNRILIPVFSYTGAAVATLITELILLAFCFLKVRQIRRVSLKAQAATGLL